MGVTIGIIGVLAAIVLFVAISDRFIDWGYSKLGETGVILACISLCSFCVWLASNIKIAMAVLFGLVAIIYTIISVTGSWREDRERRRTITLSKVEPH